MNDITRRRALLLTAGASTGITGCLRLTESEQSENLDKNRTVAGNAETPMGEQFPEVTGINLTKIKNLGGPIQFLPTHVYNEQFVGTSGDSVALVSPDGKIDWKSNEINSDYALGRGDYFEDSNFKYIRYQRDGDQLISAFDKDDGTKRWESIVRETSSEYKLNNATAGKSGIYYSINKEDSPDKTLIVGYIDASGDQIWEKEIQEGNYVDELRYNGSNLYVGTSDRLFNKNPNSGETNQKYTINVNGMTIDTNTIYVNTGRGLQKIYLNEDEVGKNRTNIRNPIGDPMVKGEYVFVRSDGGWIDAYSTEDESHVWEARLPAEPGRASLGENIIWASWYERDEYGVHAIDIKTGKTIFKRQADKYLATGNRVIINDTDSPDDILYEVEEIKE
mgnify:CR=1 FL=1